MRLEKPSFCRFSLKSVQTVKWQNGQKLFFFGESFATRKTKLLSFSVLEKCADSKMAKWLKALFFETSNRDFCWRKVNKSKQIRKFHQNQKTRKLLVDQQNKKEVCMQTFQQTTKKLCKSEVRENQHTVPKVDKTRLDVVNCTRVLASGLSTLFLFQALIN